MRTRLKDLLFSSDQDLQLRLFTLSGVVSSVALFFIAVLSVIAGQRADIVVIIVLMCIFVVISTIVVQRHAEHKDFFGSIIVLLAIFIIYPLGYFWGGGTASGTPIWFILIAIYISSIFTGKRVWIFLAIAAVVYVAITYYSYIHPELVTPLASTEAIYIDICSSAIAVGVLVAALMRYQAAVFERENKLAREQKEEIESLS